MTSEQRQFASMLACLTLASIITLPLLAMVIWLFWDQLAPLVAGKLHYRFNLGERSLLERLIGFFISLAGALVQAYGLKGLHLTFSEAALGCPLSETSIKGFRRFAWITVIMVFIGIAQRSAWIILFSLSDPLHPGTLGLKFGSEELKSLFMGSLLVFVAHVFIEGKRAKDENDTFV